jgi:putative ABC transport system permease protein
LKSKTAILHMQREINEYAAEPLTAIIPGKSIQELWKLVSVLERAFLAVSVVAFILSLTGMFLVFVTTISERKREMAILRTVGARPWFVASLLIMEAAWIAVCGSLFSLVFLHAAFAFAGPWIESKIALRLALSGSLALSWKLVLAVVCAAAISAIIPSIQIYRDSLNEALMVER